MINAKLNLQVGHDIYKPRFWDCFWNIKEDLPVDFSGNFFFYILLKETIIIESDSWNLEIETCSSLTSRIKSCKVILIAKKIVELIAKSIQMFLLLLC